MAAGSEQGAAVSAGSLAGKGEALQSPLGWCGEVPAGTKMRMFGGGEGGRESLVEVEGGGGEGSAAGRGKAVIPTGPSGRVGDQNLVGAILARGEKYRGGQGQGGTGPVASFPAGEAPGPGKPRGAAKADSIAEPLSRRGQPWPQRGTPAQGRSPGLGRARRGETSLRGSPPPPRRAPRHPPLLPARAVFANKLLAGIAGGERCCVWSCGFTRAVRGVPATGTHSGNQQDFSRLGDNGGGFFIIYLFIYLFIYFRPPPRLFCCQRQRSPPAAERGSQPGAGTPHAP